MELKDTIEMMTSADYKERFKAEYYQLKIRLEKLHAIITKMRAGTLEFKPKRAEWSLLQQYYHMHNYLRALEHAAHEEGIELDKKLDWRRYGDLEE